MINILYIKFQRIPSNRYGDMCISKMIENNSKAVPPSELHAYKLNGVVWCGVGVKADCLNKDLGL